jgi:hypothetical protein
MFSALLAAVKLCGSNGWAQVLIEGLLRFSSLTGWVRQDHLHCHAVHEVVAEHTASSAV